MSYDLKLSFIINASRPEVFNYFTDAVLLETWCYPEGMTLIVPYFENNLHGRYRYEHTDGQGKVYICQGVITGYETNRRLLTLDSVVTDEGEMLLDQMETDIIFLEDAGGCQLEITQKGFSSQEVMKECLRGWEQCLDRLNSLFGQLQQSSL